MKSGGGREHFSNQGAPTACYHGYQPLDRGARPWPFELNILTLLSGPWHTQQTPWNLPWLIQEISYCCGIKWRTPALWWNGTSQLRLRAGAAQHHLGGKWRSPPWGRGSHSTTESKRYNICKTDTVESTVDSIRLFPETYHWFLNFQCIKWWHKDSSRNKTLLLSCT